MNAASLLRVQRLDGERLARPLDGETVDRLVVLTAGKAQIRALGPRRPRARPRGIDAFAIHLEPFAGSFELLDRRGMEATLATRTDANHEVATLRSDVHQVVDDPA